MVVGSVPESNGIVEEDIPLVDITFKKKEGTTRPGGTLDYKRDLGYKKESVILVCKRERGWILLRSAKLLTSSG